MVQGCYAVPHHERLLCHQEGFHGVVSGKSFSGMRMVDVQWVDDMIIFVVGPEQELFPGTSDDVRR